MDNLEIISHHNFLYSPLKLESSEKCFATSDCHFNHNKDFIYKIRGYTDVEEMNETQIKNWNSVITNEDTVFYLGDFKFGTSHSYEHFLRRLNFKKIFLMAGNHFSGFQEIAQKMIGHCGYLLDGVKQIQPIPNYFEVIYKHQFIVLSHYPIGSWNKIRHGSLNLFGHCHGTYKNTCGKQLDVGMDNFPIPQTLDQIAKILNKKEVEIVDGTHQPNNLGRFFE